MEEETIIIRVTPHSEGGLSYDVFTQDVDDLYETEPEDGGIFESAEEEPTIEEYEDAMNEAVRLAVSALRRKADEGNN